MMGLDPRRVDLLTLTEFRAMFAGFAAFHGSEQAAISRSEYEAILAEEMAAGRA